MRSFISVDIEKEKILTKLHKLTKQITKTDADTNPVAKENLHITVKFLGEIDKERVPEIRNVIQKYAKKIEPFSITLTGMGAFPSPKRPKVVWVGGKKDKKLVRLAQKIRKELERRGFKKDQHSYTTHITLARVDWYTDELKRLISENKNINIGELHIDTIQIKKSKLTNEGPIYRTIEAIRLGET